MTEITHEFGASSRFSGNSFVGCIKAGFFFFHFQCIITLIENKFALPFNQNEIESSRC
jgi:hypothetical protein